MDCGCCSTVPCSLTVTRGPMNLLWAFQVARVVKNPSTNARDIRVVGSTPGLGRSPSHGGRPRLEGPWACGRRGASVARWGPRSEGGRRPRLVSRWSGCLVGPWGRGSLAIRRGPRWGGCLVACWRGSHCGNDRGKCGRGSGDRRHRWKGVGRPWGTLGRRGV